MGIFKRKICLLGTFAVGKTSLVDRFVHARFDEKYLTTVGISVSQKLMPPIQSRHSGRTVQVMFLIWDIAGPEVDRGILIIEDVTEKAMATQAVNQQRYDLYLYRQSIDHRRNQIETGFEGRSPAIKRIIDIVRKISLIPSATVLLMGETGTGKNLTARMIHESSIQKRPVLPPDSLRTGTG